MLTPEAAETLFPPRPRAVAARLNAWLLNVLFPPHCVACHAPVEPPRNTVLCRPCAEKIRWVGADRCRRCGDAAGAGTGVMNDCPSCRSHPPAYVESACTVGRFEKGPLRELVLSLKFGRKLHIAPVLGRLLAQRVRATGLLEAGRPAVVVPVPVAPEQARGGDWRHADEIAGTASVALQLPIAKSLLRKVRVTPPQATLKRMQRRVNLKDAFDSNPDLVRRFAGHTVLLVDDVITTGSTISECARALHAAGFESVRAAAVARA